ncbi:hypothetical protein L1049_011496 [Liquidambar formosana]|uniref:Uncharacterized protein n=1 Tax=Liquidambar formosana TaxID=63359 RepID=A0AAP0RRQ5_LIQFO
MTWRKCQVPSLNVLHLLVGACLGKAAKILAHSLEKKHRDSSTRRRSSFASSGSSSPKHRLGKSCRQIRRREMRSTVGELKVDGVMLDSQSNGVPSHSEGLCNCSESGPGILGEGSEIHEEKNLLKGQFRILGLGCLVSYNIS